MAFYEELSRFYDIIFNKDENTVDFLKKGLSSNNRVMDLACGTGTYSIEIAKEGHNVIGIDLDGNMIEKARAKAQNIPVQFYREDMRSFKGIAGDNLYDMIFCIGNSLVHLSDSQEIGKLFLDIYNSLKEGGWMVIQIINYDRIKNKNITSLPTIDRSREGVIFIRNYNLDPGKTIANFQTELIIADKDGEKKYRNSVPLLAINSDEIIELVKKSGFSSYQCYGGFDGSEFNEDSYALIIKCYH